MSLNITRIIRRFRELTDVITTALTAGNTGKSMAMTWDNTAQTLTLTKDPTFDSQRINNTTPSTSTTTGALIVAGGGGFGGDVNAALFRQASNSYPTSDALLYTASLGYLQSRLQNLVTNGNGLLRSNYNFSRLEFDPIELPAGGGSFKFSSERNTIFSDEFIPVSPAGSYRLSLEAKSGNVDGSSYVPTEQQYFGLACYDADFLLVQPQHNTKVSGSADTTLSVALNPGDTTITVGSTSGWSTTANGIFRQITWWPYVNSFGYSYPAYTYSRNTSRAYSEYASAGLWSTTGISGNTITLTSPWVGPALPAGTPVSNSGTGGVYKYTAGANVNVPNSWTTYTGVIQGVNALRDNNNNEFPYGTAYIQLLFLLNWNNSVSGNILRIGSINFGQNAGTYGTGFVANTGTADKSSVATYTAPTIAGTYTQSQIQDMANRLQTATQQIKALKDALIAHGIIGA